MSKKLIAAENRLVLALNANAPAETVDLLKQRVIDAGGDPNSVVPAHAGDVTVPSNPLPMPMTEQDKAIVQMLSELSRRQRAVDELKEEQRQVEADLVEIQEELEEAERELREFVRRESRRGHPASEPLDAA